MNKHGRPHIHAEAFCLMRYLGTDGTRIEVWNSRDGVTPYTFQHPRTGVRFQHVEWQCDRYMPGRIPSPGDWVFVDLTPERAMEKRRAMVADPATWAAMQAHEHFAGRDAETIARELAEGDVVDGPAPDVIQWPDKPRGAR